MGKKARRKLSNSNGHTCDHSPTVAQAGANITNTSPFLLLGNGYQAADNSPSRGYLYWPSTDTRRQMTPLTRAEILRRIQWLYAHFGFCRRLVNGMARLLGYIIPQPNCSDDEWNDLAFAAIIEVMANAVVWDIQGKFDGLIGQVQDNVSIFRDGFVLAVMTQTTSGRARLAYYEAHQIANGPDTNGTGWEDGVLLSRSGAHLAYSVRDGEDPNVFSVVPATDCLYIGNFENRGQVHAMSILTTAVLNMIDVVETRGFTKQGLKAHSRLGTVIEQEMGQVIAMGGGGLTGTLLQTMAPQQPGQDQPQMINWEAVYSGALTPQLKPGQKVKVVADDRPSQNSMEFEKALLRDCAWGADLSYETLCDVSGITGPGIRFLNAELKRWIMLRRYPQVKRVHRQTAWLLAKEMKSGRLRLPKTHAGEKWWTKIEYIGLADMDIDGGRTAQATLTDLRSGQTTWLDRWGTQGAFWKSRIKQAVHEVVFAELECLRQAEAAGLPPERVTPERVFPDRFTATLDLPPVDTSQIKPDPDLSDPGDEPEAIDQ